MNRRTFLASAIALPLVACDSEKPRRGLLGAMERANARVQRGLFRPNHVARELPQSAETAVDAFPSYHVASAIPTAPAGWRLNVSGMVARPRSFTLEELQAMTRADLRVRHYCVEGWSAVASWHGVRLRDLAQAVGADPSAGYVELRSFDVDPDGKVYYSCWDRESALHPQTILAYGMNGAPLGPAHGGPLRLYSSVKLGYKMVKYLTEIRFLPSLTGGYWEDLGYEWYAGV